MAKRGFETSIRPNTSVAVLSNYLCLPILTPETIWVMCFRDRMIFSFLYVGHLLFVVASS